MATFFPNSNDQREAASMIYSRELVPNSYSEAPPVISANMMMYMNYLSSSGTDTLAVNSHQNSCNDIVPVDDSVSNHFGGSRIGEHDLSEWGNGRSEMSFMPSMGGDTGLLQTMQNLQGQGLSLSLSTQIPSAMQMPCVEYRNPNPGFSSFLNPNLTISSETSGNSDTMKTCISPYEMPSIPRIISNSKYLKAAQQLLDEVVSVWKAVNPKESKKDQIKRSNEGDGGLKDETSNQQESVSNSPKELAAAERQSLQDKLTKLLSLLDEVDKRYKQYYHQMQIVASSFDVIAGCGAAKPYTALALQTISRHFRCLRDAITGQIQVLRKNLGEQDTSENNKGVGISRLRFVDHHLRQQRVLQQLGMMQQHAWRPQRGLPESSVSILRAWLFEHFLHPYPKDSDKSMLARKTGLTRSQVSNWFINARVRLWKPMVEEMYKEETGDAEMDSNCSSEAEHKTIKGDTITTASEDINEDFKQNATSADIEPHGTGQYLNSKHHHHIPNVEMVGTETEYGVLRSKGEQRLCLDDSHLYPDTIVQSDEGSGRFMISELGNFGNGKGVSLTLGLQHCEGSGFPMSVDTHHGFVTMRGDGVYNTASSSVGPQTEADFDCMDSGNRPQRFGSSHMFHDFVA